MPSDSDTSTDDASGSDTYIRDPEVRCLHHATDLNLTGVLLPLGERTATIGRHGELHIDLVDAHTSSLD